MTRTAGWVKHARGLGLHDHVCWAYDDLDEFRARAGEFLADGLAAGQRVRLIGPTDLGDLVGRDERLAEAMRSGSAEVVALDTVYPSGTVVEPAEQVRAYGDATDEALAAGYSGLRVAADATVLVETPEQLESFVHYEHLVDRYMADRPFAAMCAYDRTRLGEPVVEQLACLHPVSNAEPVGFRLHASADGSAVLAGEIDLSTQDLLALTLDRIDLRPPDDELVLDATDLEFMDHNGLLHLVEYSRRRGATLVLRTSWPGVDRLIRLLDVPDVRVEPVA